MADRAFLVAGTALIIMGIVALIISHVYSNLEQGKRDSIRKLDYAIDQQIWSYRLAENHRATTILLLSQYSDQASPLEAEIRRSMSGAILNIADAAGITITNSTTDQDICGTLSDFEHFASCMDRHVQLAKEALDDSIASNEVQDGRADRLRRTWRAWQYAAHILNVVGIVVIMLRELTVKPVVN